MIGIAKTFTKDIVLLTAADGDSVPRGSKRAVLHNDSRIANMVDFRSSWTEQEVIQRIDSCFKGIIDVAQPSPRYIYLFITEEYS